jgi:hypothetical protein
MQMHKLRMEASKDKLSIPVKDALNEQIEEMKKARDSMNAFIESGSYDKILKADTAVKKAIAENNIMSIQEIAELHVLVGQERTADWIVKFAAASESASNRDLWLSLSPEDRGIFNITRWMADGEKGLKFLFTGAPESAPSNAREEMALLTTFKTALTNEEEDDSEFVRILENLESAVSAPDILSQFQDRSGKVSRVVFRNPKLQKKFASIYTDELQDVGQMLENFRANEARLASRGITVERNDQGFWSVVAKESKIPSAGRPTVEGERELREAVVRANNLLRLRKSYGSILENPQF